MAIFAPDVGIDLGTSRTRIYVRGKGILVDEATVSAVERGGKRALWAVGEDALALVGRTTSDAEIVHPLAEGVVQDFEITTQMIRYFMRKAIGSSFLVGPKVFVTVPCRTSPVERRLVRRAMWSAKARQNGIRLIEKPLATALGCDLPVFDPVASMVVNVGGGTTEAAVISMGGIVVSRSVRTGGLKMDEAVQEYAKKDFNLIIGDRTAEDVKITLGRAVPPEQDLECVVRGRDMVTNLPRTTALSSQKVYEALEPGHEVVLGAIRYVLNHTPPELAGDILKRGIYLAGGASQIYGLDQYIEENLNIPVHIPKDPARCTTNGIGYLIENQDELTRLARSVITDEETKDNKKEHGKNK